MNTSARPLIAALQLKIFSAQAGRRH